jgi:hypothetical protein
MHSGVHALSECVHACTMAGPRTSQVILYDCMVELGFPVSACAAGNQWTSACIIKSTSISVYTSVSGLVPRYQSLWYLVTSKVPGTKYQSVPNQYQMYQVPGTSWYRRYQVPGVVPIAWYLVPVIAGTWYLWYLALSTCDTWYLVPDTCDTWYLWYLAPGTCDTWYLIPDTW